MYQERVTNLTIEATFYVRPGMKSIVTSSSFRHSYIASRSLVISIHQGPLAASSYSMSVIPARTWVLGASLSCSTHVS